VGQRDRHAGEGALSQARVSRGTVGLVSLGCPKNLVDSEVMLGRLQGRGYDLVADAREADVIVVNTCAFIDRAKQESVDTILEMAKEKETGRAKRLVVTGCLSQRYDEELRREIPEIDATLGTGQVDDIVKAVEGESSVDDSAPTWVYDHTAPRVLSTAPWMAYVKISEGCDYTCSFCIIPTLRGRHRSRNLEDILSEVRGLAARGVKEIVLVAQDSTRYGLDHGIRDGLAYLLRRLGRVDGIRWIRVMYAYPATLTDPILDAMASEEKVVKYVDIPLQHASDAVLRRMKRPTGKGNLLGMIERIRARVPGVAIRTSFIVGFPGETDADFQELLDFVEAARFDNVGVFTFSEDRDQTQPPPDRRALRGPGRGQPSGERPAPARPQRVAGPGDRRDDRHRRRRGRSRHLRDLRSDGSAPLRPRGPHRGPPARRRSHRLRPRRRRSLVTGITAFGL
jgi:ribosomal protein S12 methylthiotransferase